MCEPTTIIAGVGMGLQLASTLVGDQAERQAAGMERESAVDALDAQLQGLDDRAAEETIAAAQKVRETGRTRRALAATATVAAGEAGVAGVSVALLLGDLERQAGERRESIRTNRDLALKQIKREAASAQTVAQARVNRAQGPSKIETGLKLGGTVLPAFGKIFLRSSPELGSDIPEGSVGTLEVENG